MADNASCVDQARLDVLRLQPRITSRNRFRAVSCGEPTAANDRLPEEFLLKLDLLRHVQVSAWVSITLVIYGRCP